MVLNVHTKTIRLIRGGRWGKGYGGGGWGGGGGRERSIATLSPLTDSPELSLLHQDAGQR